jgi:hypothetical protein
MLVCNHAIKKVTILCTRRAAAIGRKSQHKYRNIGLQLSSTIIIAQQSTCHRDVISSHRVVEFLCAYFGSAYLFLFV